jgi:predicted ATPase
MPRKDELLQHLKDIYNVLCFVAEEIKEENVADEIYRIIEDKGYDQGILYLFDGILTELIIDIINNGKTSLFTFELTRDIKIFVLPLLEDYAKINYLGGISLEKFGTLETFKQALDNNIITKKDFLNNLESIKYIYEWVDNFLNFTNQKEQINFNTNKLLPFALKYFSISNFQCIKHIEAQLPVDAQFIVFTGENGDGKTSILQALGLGFYNAKDLTDNEKGNVETVISVQYKANENSYHNEIYNNPKYPVLYSLRNNIKELKSFATYGASRLTISEKKDLQNPLLNLITDKAKLYDITESWLRDIAVNEPQKYQEVCDILVSLLPNVSEIRKVNPTKIISDLVFMEKGVAVELKNLSSGHKSIVLMIGDMLMRLAEAQPEITNPKDFAGIVLIDELETHLHPKWQKEFSKILAETFPKVQFIVTTHSAITLLGMPKNTVFFKVKRTEEEGTQIERLDIDVENLTPNLLLSSPIFGLNDIFSVQNKGMENVHTGNFFDEKDTRQQAKDKIRALYKQLKDKEN